MSDLDQDRKSSDAVEQPVSGGAEREKLQGLLLSAFVHQQEQVRKQIDNTGRLAAVLAIQQEITSREPDLEEVLSLVSNRAVTILGATGCAIALQRDGTMVCRASGGATGPALGAHLSSEFGLSGECLRTGCPMLCNDVEKDSRVDTAAARLLGIRSLIVAPVFHHRTTVGVLEVFSCESDFFDKDDAHVVELLGGMITTAISYSSEFEAKQTLESERSAMLEVIERITPTITRMLEQQSMAAAPDRMKAGELEEFRAALPESDIKEELAHSGAAEFAEYPFFPHVPDVSERSASSEEDLSNEGVEDQANVGADDADHEEELDGISEPSFEGDDEMTYVAGAPHPIATSDCEKRAINSAIEILLSNEHVLTPEPPVSGEASSADERAGSDEPPIDDEPVQTDETATIDQVALPILFAPARPAWPVLAPKPQPASTPVDEFQWPEPEAPLLAPGAEPDGSPAAVAAEGQSGSSALGEWSLPALLQTRTAVSAPRGEPSSRVASSASTMEYFGLAHDPPAIPAAGTVKASKAVGTSAAPLGKSRGEMPLTLRLRNILEYVVPAVLTGLLIVVGLQWLTSDHRWPSFLDSNPLKAPPPSMFTPVRGAPVEVSLLKIPASSGLSRTGKEINERVSAIVGYDRGNTEDWSQSAKKFGKQLSDKLPDPPSIASDKNSVGNTASALSGLEKILPSNALGNSWGTSPKTDLKSPVGQVHLPVESIEDYILVRVQPTYPQMARQNNITGTVVLSTVIGRDGSVRDVRAVSGNKYLAEAAMAAVSQWRYKPFVLNGKPIEVATELKIAFTRRPGQQRVSRQ